MAAPGSESRPARLARMLRSYHREVWCLLRRLGVWVEAADDAAQQVFWVAADKLEAIEPQRERRFLLGTALRVAANMRRAQQARREQHDSDLLAGVESSTPLPDVLLDHKRMRELLDGVLDRLTPDLRTAFVLFEVEGLSAPEISELLEVPLGTVASRLRRAREAFDQEVSLIRQKLAAQGGEP